MKHLNHNWITFVASGDPSGLVYLRIPPFKRGMKEIIVQDESVNQALAKGLRKLADDLLGGNNG